MHSFDLPELHYPGILWLCGHSFHNPDEWNSVPTHLVWVRARPGVQNTAGGQPRHQRFSGTVDYWYVDVIAGLEFASTHPKINLSLWKYESEEVLGVRKRINTTEKSTYQSLMHVACTVIGKISSEFNSELKLNPWNKGESKWGLVKTWFNDMIKYISDLLRMIYQVFRLCLHQRLNWSPLYLWPFFTSGMGRHGGSGARRREPPGRV